MKGVPDLWAVGLPDAELKALLMSDEDREKIMSKISKMPAGKKNCDRHSNG